MTKKLFFFYLLTIIILPFVISGCKQIPLSAQSANLPNWVLSPTQDNVSTLYGLGQGSTLANAKQAALADVAAKLFVTVSGSTVVEIQSNNNVVLESVRDSIKTQINETNLSHYHVEQVALIEGTYWVQLNIPRTILIQHAEKSLNNNNPQLEASFVKFKDYSSVQKYVKIDHLNSRIEEGMSSWVLLQALDPSRKSDTLDKLYSNYRASLLQAKEALSFAIMYSKDTHAFADHLAVLLSKESIETKLLSNKKNNGPVIRISGEFKTYALFDEKQVQADITITVHDERGVLIAKRHHSLAGSSVSNYGLAKRSAARQLSDRFEENGVLKSLGITNDT